MERLLFLLLLSLSSERKVLVVSARRAEEQHRDLQTCTSFPSPSLPTHPPSSLAESRKRQYFGLSFWDKEWGNAAQTCHLVCVRKGQMSVSRNNCLEPNRKCKILGVQKSTFTQEHLLFFFFPLLTWLLSYCLFSASPFSSSFFHSTHHFVFLSSLLPHTHFVIESTPAEKPFTSSLC